jgi:hypothetical protein
MLLHEEAFLQHDDKLVEEHVLARLELEVLCYLLRRPIFGGARRRRQDAMNSLDEVYLARP